MISKAIKKAAGGCKTTTATTSHYATNFMAAVARQASGIARFPAKPCHGIGRAGKDAVKGCDTVLSTPAMGPVRKNIVIDSGAHTHALSWVFPRSEFSGTGFPVSHGYGRDGLVRKAGRMAESMFLTSCPPDARKNANGGFQSHSGAEAMTNPVNTPTTPKSGNTSPLARQHAIESALSEALHFVRLPHTESGLKAATGRAIRAASMLKQACSEGRAGAAE